MNTITLNRKLNKNFFFFIIVIVIIIFSLIFSHGSKKPEKTNNNLITFSSSDTTISLSIYDSFGFSEKKSDDYLLELISENSNSGIYVSKISTNNIRDSRRYIEADKNDYISKFSNISEVSDISESTLQSCLVYNYHFFYNSSMFVDIYWILKDNNFYVIDFNIDTNIYDLNNFASNILNSIKFN